HLAHRVDDAVADRREGLDAEEEGVLEGRHPVALGEAGEGAGAARQVEEREEDVQAEVEPDHDAEELRPRGRQQEVVGRERLDQAQALALDVEAAVPVEQPLPALARDDGAESQVAVDVLPPGGGNRHGGLGGSSVMHRPRSLSQRPGEGAGTGSPVAPSPLLPPRMDESVDNRAVPLHSAEALILSVADLHDRDRIVVFLTRDLGKKRGVAKGARTRHSRYAGQLQPLAKVQVTWFAKEGAELARISSVELVRAAGK